MIFSLLVGSNSNCGKRPDHSSSAWQRALPCNSGLHLLYLGFWLDKRVGLAHVNSSPVFQGGENAVRDVLARDFGIGGGQQQQQQGQGPPPGGFQGGGGGGNFGGGPQGGGGGNFGGPVMGGGPNNFGGMQGECHFESKELIEVT